ncbi:hypothetical protein [Tabrizicola sp.]|uniref:hypothetical protein n=1 Tax=Tabrizicola sp. TaxID=2005166 RepID=UPI00286B4C59|nr:hypothetical protein [Tabrizicola sp.]
MGGRPLTKPRPGLEPGPPTTPSAPQKVRGQARDAVALTLAALLLATQATAQIIPTGTPAADIVLTQGIADWRIFVTCSALDYQTNWNVVDELYHDITAASAILKANNVPQEAIAAFAAAADPEALSPPPDTPFADVQELCLAHPDWSDRWLDRAFTFLERDLAKAFP